MRKLVETTINLGVDPKADYIEQKRVKFLNSLLLIVLALIFVYALGNFAVGTFEQGLLILACIPIGVAPSLFLNLAGRTKTSRNYFIIISLILIHLLAFNSISNFENRTNEIFILGFSAMVVVLFDNPWKRIMFSLFQLSIVSLLTYRFYINDHPFDGSYILSIINVAAAGFCVYFFTSIFKGGLTESLDRISTYSSEIEEHQAKIINQHHELMKNRLYLRSLIDKLPVYLSMIDKDNKFLIVNNLYAESFKMSVHQLEGQYYTEILPEEYVQRRKAVVDQCLAGNEIEIDEEISITDGEKVNVFGKYMPLYDYDDNVIGAFAYAMDVTKLKSIEKELKVHNKTKDKLLSIVSHDFRTPLNSLKEVLALAEHIDPGEMENIIHKLSIQVNTVSSTLDNLLGWVKTQFEGFHAKPEKVDLSKIVEKSVALYELPLSNKSIEVINDLDENSLVTADPDHMLLVFRNLISNSVKFTPDGGHISFEYERTNGHAFVKMKDDGIGIDETRLAELTKGQRIVKSQLGTHGEKGTGLGLSFCKDILALNNVQLNIESQVDKGTEIKMTFDESHN